uniref:Methyltransferase type 12 domain-containing protein n=1 Tax=uncultured microorganism TaxID=358574 RepID=F8UHP7_9ZZZZ|nr:methyltransferase type 12 domain-containing protein [uncultured microorganism]
MSGLASDARILWAMLRGLPQGATHAQRLDAFYAPQADRYDSFREGLLHGRDELVAMLPVRRGGHIVELGGGTGRNAERFGPRLARLDSYTLVELSAPMLAKARERAARLPGLRVVEGDAATWRPGKPADCAFFSYSLTMIPDWRAAIDNAIALVRPGGLVASVDFYVSAAAAAPGMRQHGPLTRWFWPRWFGHDGVRLDPAHLDYLRSRLQAVALHERSGTVPWLPGLRVPHYLFVGRRRAHPLP